MAGMNRFRGDLGAARGRSGDEVRYREALISLRISNSRLGTLNQATDTVHQSMSFRLAFNLVRVLVPRNGASGSPPSRYHALDELRKASPDGYDVKLTFASLKLLLG